MKNPLLLPSQTQRENLKAFSKELTLFCTTIKFSKEVKFQGIIRSNEIDRKISF